MRHGTQIRAGTVVARKAKGRPAVAGAFAAVTPPRAARPAGLENLRAGLLGCLAREPAVCRSIGLVR
jgi:hypothetical protein